MKKAIRTLESGNAGKFSGSSGKSPGPEVAGRCPERVRKVLLAAGRCREHVTTVPGWRRFRSALAASVFRFFSSIWLLSGAFCLIFGFFLCSVTPSFLSPSFPLRLLCFVSFFFFFCFFLRLFYVFLRLFTFF